jgi:hypothetical protein
MIITIQLQTKEELQFLQPLLELLKKINAQVEVQDATGVEETVSAYTPGEVPAPEKENVKFTVLHVADKSFKFNREEAHER